MGQERGGAKWRDRRGHHTHCCRAVVHLLIRHRRLLILHRRGLCVRVVLVTGVHQLLLLLLSLLRLMHDARRCVCWNVRLFGGYLHWLLLLRLPLRV